MATISPIRRKPRGQSRKGIEGRLWEKISPEPNSGCWLWVGALNTQGYGLLYVNGRLQGAHRACYELYVGTIPPDCDLDHLCRVVCCVNPQHLEAVSHQENCRRGTGGIISGAQQRNKTHCPSGHPYDIENTYHHPKGYRACRACARERMRRKLAKAK